VFPTMLDFLRRHSPDGTRERPRVAAGARS
jgi:hypothetical protein